MFLFQLFPIGIILVLFRFNSSPEQVWNGWKCLMAIEREFKFVIIRVVPSAIKLSLKIVLLISMPSILSSDLIHMAIISATNRNNKAEIGQPCQSDLESWK